MDLVLVSKEIGLDSMVILKEAYKMDWEYFSWMMEISTKENLNLD